MKTPDPERNYLEESLAILNGTSRMLPEKQHLIALNESRLSWRHSYWQITKHLPKAPERKAVPA